MRHLYKGGDPPAVPLRDNPGSGEHAFVNAFNQSLKENPIPVGH